MILPDSIKDLTRFALDTIEVCRTDQGQRAAAYRVYGQWIETGRAAGGLALANMLYHHVDQLSSHLYSPTDLRFSVSYRHRYPKEMLLKAEVAARVLSEEWELKDIDELCGDAVFEALSYGAAIPKLVNSVSNGNLDVDAELVAPWNFGVYHPGRNDIDKQEAVCETVYLTKHEIWRRIQKLDNPEKLMRRIMAQGNKNEGVGVPTSFMHQVLSTAVLDVSLQNATQPQPGGIVQLSNDPSFATLGPQMGADLFPLHELWVRDDQTGDWTTIQIVEPDILIAPRFKRTNLFCPNILPYGLVQPNVVRGYFWGRSEIVDLMQLQQLLTTSLDDIKRVMGQNFDKLLAFAGMDGIQDEAYGQFRSQGYINLGQGGSVTDLTPKMPDKALEFIELLLALMERVSGFSNVLSGRGESGVRAGSHAETLQRMASPRLRDRSLRVERQIAKLGDKTLSCMEAKDATAYWTNPETGDEGDFVLSQIPDDRRVTVDSHSSSPIYHEDHQNLIGFGVKSGFIGGDSAIEALPFPNKDVLIDRYKEMEKAKQQLVQEHPELLQHGGKKH